MLTWKQVRGPCGVSIVFPSRLGGRDFEFLGLSADSGLTLIACGAESGTGRACSGWWRRAGERRRHRLREADLTGDEASGAAIVKVALTARLMQIAVNAGLEGSVVSEKVLSLPAGTGLNASTGESGDMFEAGIVDPAQVKGSALQNVGRSPLCSSPPRPSSPTGRRHAGP